MTEPQLRQAHLLIQVTLAVIVWQVSPYILRSATPARQATARILAMLMTLPLALFLAVLLEIFSSWHYDHARGMWSNDQAHRPLPGGEHRKEEQ